MKITSLKNPKIKNALSLREKSGRDKLGLFGVEGAREILRAVESGFKLDEVFVCEKCLSNEGHQVVTKIEDGPSSEKTYEITAQIFSKLAVRENKDGIFAVFQKKEFFLKDLKLPPNPLLLIVEGVEKPGNLGALLRSADGAGTHAVIVIDDSVDIYNPNVIRASLGTFFHVPVVQTAKELALSFCTKNEIKIFSGSLEANQYYYDLNFKQAAAIILGSEALGLSDFWIKNSDCLVKIPMLGIADSLNLSVAGAILLYEACRQRLLPS